MAIEPRADEHQGIPGDDPSGPIHNDGKILSSILQLSDSALRFSFFSQAFIAFTTEGLLQKGRLRRHIGLQEHRGVYLTGDYLIALRSMEDIAFTSFERCG